MFLKKFRHILGIYCQLLFIFVSVYCLLDRLLSVVWCVVENENHCDFVRLREMLVRTNMEDLRETTHYQHYELYRRCKLQEMGFSDDEAMRCLDYSRYN